MKAKELMIGNWLMLDGHPRRVVQVTTPTVAGDLYDGWTLENGEENAGEPIQLTADILQKNGIVLQEVGDHGVLTPKRDYNRFEKWFIHTQWKDTYLYYDRLTKRYCLNGLNGVHFAYVHQLQQALNFAGIDKEIEL